MIGEKSRGWGTALRRRWRPAGVILMLALIAGGTAPSARAQGNTSITNTTSTTDTIVFNAPTATTTRVNTFSTEIIGRLAGGTVFDQTFAVAFSDPTVQNGVTAARLAITTAGGPGIVVLGPTLRSHTETLTSTSTSVYSLAGTNFNVTTATTFGPTTIVVGNRTSCGAAIAGLPSTTAPACGPVPAGTTFIVAAGTLNVNTNTQTIYLVDTATTTNETLLIAEIYELTGTVQAVGVVYGALPTVQQDATTRFIGGLLQRGGGLDLGAGALSASPLAPPGRQVAALAGPMLERLGLADQQQAQAGDDKRSGLVPWLRAYGVFGDVDANNGAPGFRWDRGGVMAGAEYRWDDGLTVGFGLGYATTGLKVPSASERADINSLQVGLYAGYVSGPWRLSGAASFTYDWIDTRRSIAGIGTSTAHFGGQEYGLAAEVGYRFEVGGFAIEPVAGLSFISVRTARFNEAGTGLFDLAGRPATTNALYGSLGAQVRRQFSIDDMKFGIEARARWQHDFLYDGRSVTAAFAAAPGTSLAVQGAKPGRDAALLGLTVGTLLAPGVRLYAGYDVELRAHLVAHMVSGGVKIRW